MLSAEGYLNVFKPHQNKMLNVITDSIIFIDFIGNILFMNHSFKERFNHGKDLIQVPFQKVFPDINLKTSQNKPVYTKEICRQGHSLLVRMFNFKKKQEHIGAWVIIKKHDEQENFDFFTEDFLIDNRFLDIFSDGIAILDSDYKFKSINKAFTGLLEITDEKVLNKDSRKFFKDLKFNSDIAQEQFVEILSPQMAGEFIKVLSYPLRNSSDTLLLIRSENLMNSYQYRINILNSKIAFYQEQLEKVHGEKYNVDSIIGNSQQIKALKENIKKMSCSNCTVFLKGEKGVGKELIARALHAEGKRKMSPFIKVTCTGAGENVIDSLLFGSKGNTDSVSEKEQIGKILLADRGTLFLDEIDELPQKIQERLLEFIKTKRIETKQGKKRRVDVRIFVSTSRNLEELVRNRLFREDLYFRLNVLSFNIPPLRDRKEDIKPLIECFLKYYRKQRGVERDTPVIATDAYNALINYNWPRNVDELREVVERAVASCQGEFITTENLPVYLKKYIASGDKQVGNFTLKSILEETEKTVLLQTLEKTSGNKVKAAKMLGISRAGLYQKLQKYSLLDE